MPALGLNGAPSQEEIEIVSQYVVNASHAVMELLTSRLFTGS